MLNELTDAICRAPRCTITTIDVSCNDFSNTTNLNRFVEALVSHATVLTSLIMEQCQLTHTDHAEILGICCAHKNLDQTFFVSCRPSSLCASQFANSHVCGQRVAAESGRRSLMQGNRMGAAGLQTLAQSVSAENVRLERLNLANTTTSTANPSTQQPVAHLFAQIARHFPSLELLELSSQCTPPTKEKLYA